MTGRNVVRILLILVTVGAEALLGLLAFGLAWGGADSGSDALRRASTGVSVEMLLLLVGALACVVASRASLLVASVVGVVLLVLGLELDVASFTAIQNDANSGLFVIGFVLPGAVVLGGVGLMRSVSIGRDVGGKATSE